MFNQKSGGDQQKVGFYSKMNRWAVFKTTMALPALGQKKSLGQRKVSATSVGINFHVRGCHNIVTGEKSLLSTPTKVEECWIATDHAAQLNWTIFK